MPKIHYRETIYILSVIAPCEAVDTADTSSCAGWKAEGYCSHTYVSWMNENCKKTCTC